MGVFALHYWTRVPTTPSNMHFQGAGTDFQIALSKKDLKGEVRWEGIIDTERSQSFKCLWRNINQVSLSIFPLHSSALCVFHFLLYPLSPSSSPLSFPLAGRCWQ